MNLIDFLKREREKDNPVLDLLGKAGNMVGQGVSSVGKFVGQQPILNTITPNQITQTLAPNSALSAFTSGNSQDIIPNIASTLRTQGQNSQTPEGQIAMVSGSIGGVGQKVIPEELLAVARKSRGALDLATILSKDLKLGPLAQKTFKDPNIAVNSIDDLFREAKSRQQFSINLRNGKPTVEGEDALNAAVSDLKELPNGNLRGSGLPEQFPPELSQYDLIPRENAWGPTGNLIRKELPASAKGAEAGLYDTTISKPYQLTRDLQRVDIVDNKGVGVGHIAYSIDGDTLKLDMINISDKTFRNKGQASKALDTIMQQTGTTKVDAMKSMTSQGRDFLSSFKPSRVAQPPLKSEAGLYDTPYFHTTSMENAKAIEQGGFTGKVGRNSVASHGDMQKGVFLYPNDKAAAETFGKNFANPKVLETRVGGKVYDANTATKYGWEDNLQTQEIASNPKILAQLKKDGYVGVTSTELGQPSTFVFEPKAISRVAQPTLHDTAKLKWTDGDKGAMDGEVFQSLGNKADLIMVSEDGVDGVIVRLKNGALVQNPASDVPGGSGLFKTAEEARIQTEKFLSKAQPTLSELTPFEQRLSAKLKGTR